MPNVQTRLKRIEAKLGASGASLCNCTVAGKAALQAAVEALATGATPLARPHSDESRCFECGRPQRPFAVGPKAELIARVETLARRLNNQYHRG